MPLGAEATMVKYRCERKNADVYVRSSRCTCVAKTSFTLKYKQHRWIRFDTNGELRLLDTAIPHVHEKSRFRS